MIDLISPIALNWSRPELSTSMTSSNGSVHRIDGVRRDSYNVELKTSVKVEPSFNENLVATHDDNRISPGSFRG